jgi:Fanconi anemia group J protein
MSKTVAALSSGRNALLESPTGTGKTLALLCATLSWQDSELLRLANGDGGAAPVRVPLALAYETNAGVSAVEVSGAAPRAAAAKSARPRRKRKHTPIIYASRTHSQLAQVLGELRKMEEYHWRATGEELRVSVLASREHYCVHREVSQKPRGSKSEACKELLEHRGCRHHRRMHLLAAEVPPVWDIEELNALGREVTACPYFASRAMQKDAHIVLAPYNYLIDPCVRASMDVDLKGAVVVLDEAHNIEGVARDAASHSLTTEELAVALAELEDLARSSAVADDARAAHGALAEFVAPLLAWMRATVERLTAAEYEAETSNVWAGEAMASILARRCGLLPEGVGALEAHLAAACAGEEGHAGGSGGGGGAARAGERMSGASEALIKRLLLVLQFMLGGDMVHAADYRVALLRAKPPRARSRGRGRRGRGAGAGSWVHTLHFWCLNAAVAFVPIAKEAHAVVLTSGTLSPMRAFANELGCAFPIRLEAPHVIKPAEQLWAGVVARGPGHVALRATYKASSTWKYQDSLGRVVLALLPAIPDGVLCFFPSYAVMDKVVERWQSTDAWSQMEDEKSEVLVEPRGSGDEWLDAIRSFRSAVANGGGALFFGVCRGKLSEGIDFADRDARAVLVVGIPYPSFKDLRVKLKRAFEDERGKRAATAAAQRRLAVLAPSTRAVQRSMLAPARSRTRSGAVWYEQQAFRALNQAAGECSFMYRYILRESCSQFDSLPLQNLRSLHSAQVRLRRDRLSRRPL